MSTTGLEVFDTTVQTTNQWLNEISEVIGPDRQRAYDVLRAVLHSLRDRLTVDQAVHLGAQLPMLIRGIYYEGWRPSFEVCKLHRDEFFECVLAHFTRTALEDSDPELTIRAVFHTLSRNIAP